jgi:alginate O-acetyltransferase complex protein AlgI
MLGFRYPENFRRPYTADSMREFWRRWNITLLTWLRDYVRLPIAGQDRPTPRLYLTIVAGFCIVAWWHGAGRHAVWCGVYFGSLLALEAAGLGAGLDRLWRPVRHVYVLAAAVAGWVIAATGPAAGRYFAAMLGGNEAPTLMAARLLTPYDAGILALALLGAGPLVPSVSRWRVGVDAATTSLLMMIAATALFVWRPVALAIRTVSRRSSPTSGSEPSAQ